MNEGQAAVGVDTKADDWFIAAHQLKVNAAKGSASISFKIGSIVAQQAALIGCIGQVTGSGVPDNKLFFFDSAELRSVTGPWSLRDIKGDRGDVDNNVITSGSMLGVAFRRTGKVMFNFEIPNPDSLTFRINGQWMVKMILNLGATFVIP
jgi:hypothetical protein